MHCDRSTANAVVITSARRRENSPMDTAFSLKCSGSHSVWRSLKSFSSSKRCNMSGSHWEVKERRKWFIKGLWTGGSLGLIVSLPSAQAGLGSGSKEGTLEIPLRTLFGSLHLKHQGPLIQEAVSCHCGQESGMYAGGDLSYQHRGCCYHSDPKKRASLG